MTDLACRAHSHCSPWRHYCFHPQLLQLLATLSRGPAKRPLPDSSTWRGSASRRSSQQEDEIWVQGEGELGGQQGGGIYLGQLNLL
ncbi:unnamed protein product [Gulo gulo]|uniref:Uncharacterized protein n=1 Tax=Gulo gulo TaxID=48420 RepID=A0A9X9LTC7_GULGU|nr:unnamed protein product [Gulo gulo]